MIARYKAGPFRVAVTDPVTELGALKYKALTWETKPDVDGLRQTLAGEPFNVDTTYLGPVALSAMPCFLRAAERFWLIKRAYDALELSQCERDAVDLLAEAGHVFCPGHACVAQRMPEGWTPYKDAECWGQFVIEELPGESYVGLPLEPAKPMSIAGRRWMTLVAVHVRVLKFVTD